jgi:hypothetical protein
LRRYNEEEEEEEDDDEDEEEDEDDEEEDVEEEEVGNLVEDVEVEVEVRAAKAARKAWGSGILQGESGSRPPARAYTRPLLSSPRAVSDTSKQPPHPKHPLPPP